ncbi:hypothetical protein CCR95_19035 [Thiocystis minor]|uniref:glycosyltransferase n=1 Tax=Thiocystis minor TaxID=61597 RepID=UPI0019147E1F|nr:glycosyltransferase [Thiocystis minor]MBK5966117.1 hypothetical protein [Thiocystis minor]
MQIIVLGMHRSGTSAITRLITMMGAEIGPAHLIGGPATDNEKGFWERTDVSQLNDGLLASVDCTWDDVADFSPVKLERQAEIDALRTQAKQVVFQMDARRPWVLKDPRLCLTLPVWRPLLEVPVCVLPHRSPLEIAQSLQARDGVSLMRGVALWEQYTLAALTVSRGLPRIGISYARLIQDPIATLRDLYERLCLTDVVGLRMPSEREIGAFVESRLQHQRASLEDADGILNLSQRHLANAMEDGSALDWQTIPKLSAGATEVLHDYRRQHEHEAQARETLSRAQEHAQSLQLEIETGRMAVDDLRQQLDAARGEAAGLTANLATRETQLADLTAQLHETRAAENAKGEQIAALTAKLADLTAQLHETRAAENAKGEQIAALTAKLADLTAQLHETRVAENAKGEQIAALTAKLADLTAQLHETRVAENAKGEQIAALTTEMEISQQAFSDTQQRLEMTQHESAQASAQHQLALNIKQNEIEAIAQQITALNAQLRQLYANEVAKDGEITFLSGELKLLTSWLDEIDRCFTATLRSWRWRLGHRSVSFVEKLLWRRRVVLGAEHIQNLLRYFQDWTKNARTWDMLPRSTMLPATEFVPATSIAGIADSDRSNLTSYDLICFANIDWDARYQRPQQLAAQFARHGHRVFYVIASRGLAPDDAQGFRATLVAERIYEVELMAHNLADRYSTVLDTANTDLFAQSLGRLRDAFGIVDAVCHVHLAFWAPLVLRLRESWDWRVLYDCMDEWEDFPGIGKPLLDAEIELVRKSDIVTVTAALLEEKWRVNNPRCVLVRNGVDFDFFRQHSQPNRILGDLAHPIVGFYGALAEWVDLGLMAAAARALPDCHFVLIGDVFVTNLEGLDDLPNVHLLGRRPYTDMPKYLYHFDVCLVPFRLSQVTHAVDPVKFYEYVSAGKPVVSVPLKELDIYKDYLYFADRPETFVEQIRCALAENSPALRQRRIELARTNDWRHRYASTSDAINQAYPRVSIIIITYKNLELSQLCLERLLRNTTYPNYEIIVVDNDSRDGTSGYLQYLQERHDHIKVILNNQNRGFAAANNQGLAIATGDYLVLLNNDTVTPRGWLAPLLRHLRDSKIGLVGPVTNFVGNEAKIDVPYLTMDEMEHFAVDHMRTHAGQAFDIGMLAMFCVVMRRDVYDQVGFLDETFGIGMFEDDDYSNRIKQLGYRVVCAKDSFVHHFGQAAFKKLIETGEYHDIWKTNQAYYEKKWGEWTPHAHES